MPLPATQRRIVVGALLVGTFLASLEIMVVSPAVPVLVAELGGAGLYPWVFSAYVVTQTAMMPIYGRLSDSWGRRPTYLAAVALFAGGSLACAVAPSMPLLIAARALQGLGAGGLVPLTQTIFGDLYNVSDRTRMQAIFSLIWALSALLGPAVGGALTEHWSWRGAFWINLPPALIAGAIIAVTLPSLPARPTPAAGSPTRGFRALLQRPLQRAVVASGIALGAALLGIIGYLPVQIQAIDGGSPTDAGLAIIPLSLAWTSAAFIAGRLVRPLGFTRLVRAGTLITAIGASIAAWWTASMAGLMLFGLGMGLTISCFNVAVQEDADPEHRGQATSLALLARSIGRAVGVVVFAFVAGIPPGVEDFAAVAGLEDGLARVFVAIAACSVLAMVVAWRGFRSDVPPEVAQRRPSST
jgi:MFS family permease